MDFREIFKMYNYEIVQYRRSKCSLFAGEIWNAIKIACSTIGNIDKLDFSPN